MVGRWFPPDTLVSYANLTDPHSIVEILLKVALNTTTSQLSCTCTPIFLSNNRLKRSCLILSVLRLFSKHNHWTFTNKWVIFLSNPRYQELLFTKKKSNNANLLLKIIRAILWKLQPERTIINVNYFINQTTNYAIDNIITGFKSFLNYDIETSNWFKSYLHR